MYLKTDKSFTVSFIYLLIDQIFHRIAVNPGLDAWTLGDDAQLVPANRIEKVVAVLDFFLGRHPAASYCLPVE